MNRPAHSDNISLLRLLLTNSKLQQPKSLKESEIVVLVEFYASVPQ